MEDILLQLLREVFDDSSIDSNCSQQNCKQWDSMAQINLALAIEERFNVSLEPEEIGRMTNFNEILFILKSK